MIKFLPGSKIGEKGQDLAVLSTLDTTLKTLEGENL
jgi:hypothetical protein